MSSELTPSFMGRELARVGEGEWFASFGVLFVYFSVDAGGNWSCSWTVGDLETDFASVAPSMCDEEGFPPRDFHSLAVEVEDALRFIADAVSDRGNKDLAPLAMLPVECRLMLRAQAQQAGVSVVEVLSRTRARGPVAVRRAVMFALREKENWTYKKIAQFFGMTHATVMAGIRAHKKAAK